MSSDNSLASARFYTYRLLELIFTYPTEYTALTDAKKEKLKMIISCGIVNMGAGSIVRNQLFTIFPSGDIYDALTELLEYTPPPP